jgi:peptidoglycan/xylan/chitin deacetylase (PgdA/CDA1 family)
MKRSTKAFLLSLLLVLVLCLGLTGCSQEQITFVVPESKVPTITILAYHRIIDGGPSFIDVTPHMFDNQLSYLKDNGYNVISYEELLSYLQDKSPLPQKPVLITFDDGYKETLTNAAPILAKHKMPATLFIYSDRLKSSESSGGLTVDELKELQRLGWSIQAHTISHADLSSFAPNNKEGAMRELVENKDLIEKSLGTEVTALAYPYGAYTKEVEDWAKEAGYLTCFLIEEGPNNLNPNPYRLNRHMLYAKDTLEDFAHKVSSTPLEIIRTVPAQAQVINYRPATVIADIKLPQEVEVVKVFADLESQELKARFDDKKQRIVVETPNISYGHKNLTVRILGNDGRSYIYGWSFVIR